jgi:ribokinase
VENEDDAGRAADMLMQKGVGIVILTLGAKGAFLATAEMKELIPIVILTLGAKGAFLATAEMKELIPAFQVKAVDTTAAGDVFNGVLAVALAEGKPIKDAILFANAAAALSVTKLGAQPSAPTKKEIYDFINIQAT